MATTYKEHVGNASLLNFDYTFPAIKNEDVKVALDGIPQASTKYAVNTAVSPTRIEFNNTGITAGLQESDGAPSSGVIVRVYRDTGVEDPADKRVTFQAGSSIKAQDLNNVYEHFIFAAQEEQNQKGIFESITLDDDKQIKFGNSDDFTIEYGSDNDAKLTSTGDIIYETDGQHIFTVEGYRVFDVYEGGGVYYARVQGTFRPYTDGTYDIGHPSYEWRNIYIDGTAHIDTLDVDENAHIDGNLTINGTISDPGGTLEFADNVDVSGTTTLNGTTVDGVLDVNGQATIDYIDIDGYKVDTTSGDLHLNGATNSTIVDGTLTVVGTTTLPDITGGAVVTTGTSTSDTKVYSAKHSDALFLRQDSSELIKSGDTWSGDDVHVATTSAIDARIVDLVDNAGGFVPIANETSFPNANPDVDTNAGTIVSVPLANNLTSNGSGVISIANGTLGNSTVTIQGAAANTTYTQGFGILVETTTTLNTYTFHRYVPKATEVTTVAGSIANINTTAGAIANVNTVAGISGNVTTVAGISANVTTVANDGTDIGTVAGSIANVNTTAGSISNVNTTAGSIANVNTTAGSIVNVNAVAGNATNINAVAGNATNVNAVAGNATNINAVAADATDIGTTAGSITNVNTVASNISDVNKVAAIDSDVTAVAGDAADIGTCSTNIGNIAAIGSDLANNYANITDYGSITGAVSATSGTSDITTVADNLTNINAVAGKNTEIGRLGTADAVADMALLGTTACVADMAILGTADIVSDLNTLATADVVSDMNTLATAAIVSDMDTLADISANITTVSTNNANVTTCANSIANINTAPTHASNALAYKNTTITYRNETAALLTQVESSAYNLADSASTHTAWGDITDTGANAAFANETSNILLTMSEGSASYDYGSIT